MSSDFHSFDSERGSRGFPTTRGSAVAGVSSDDPAARARAWSALVAAYFRPVYLHVRLKWRRDVEDARDLTQGFFARAFEHGAFAGYDPERARFRTYLRASLDHYVADRTREEGRQKRGGGGIRLSLDFDVAEDELARSGALDVHDPVAVDACFEQEWMRGLFASALAALEATCAAQGKQLYFDVFRRYVLDPEMAAGAPSEPVRPSYAEVAAACGVAVTDVTNYLSWTRRALRAKVLEQLRELTANEEDFREEARAVLGILP